MLKLQLVHENVIARTLSIILYSIMLLTITAAVVSRHDLQGGCDFDWADHCHALGGPVRVLDLWYVWNSRPMFLHGSFRPPSRVGGFGFPPSFARPFPRRSAHIDVKLQAVCEKRQL